VSVISSENARSARLQNRTTIRIPIAVGRRLSFVLAPKRDPSIESCDYLTGAQALIAVQGFISRKDAEACMISCQKKLRVTARP
jgi:hypothetical protein